MSSMLVNEIRLPIWKISIHCLCDRCMYTLEPAEIIFLFFGNVLKLEILQYDHLVPVGRLTIFSIIVKVLIG